MSDQHTFNKYVNQFALREHLNDDLLGCLRVYRFAPQQAIYNALTEQTHLYFLVEGKAQVSYYLANGKRSIIMIVTPFSVIGDMEFLGDEPVQMDVIATEHSIVLGIKKSDALAYGYNDAAFLRFIIRYMSTKLRTSGLHQLSYDFPLLNRVAIYLLNQPISDNCITIESKTVIADFLGTTPRHLNRVIKTLEDNEVISWQKNIVVISDFAKLQDYGELG